LSGVAAALVVFAARRDHRFDVLAAAAACGAAGPLLWNAILRRVEGGEFFVDARVSVMPASWQDTGSGVFTVAVAALVLGFGPHRDEPGPSRRAVGAALWPRRIPRGRVPVVIRSD
jgi:hypothetical protein